MNLNNFALTLETTLSEITLRDLFSLCLVFIVWYVVFDRIVFEFVKMVVKGFQEIKEDRKRV